MENYINKVKEQTQLNDHTGALIAIAGYIVKKHKSLEGIEKLIKQFEAVKALHEFYGFLPENLRLIREDVKAQAFSLLNSSEKQKFNEVL